MNQLHIEIVQQARTTYFWVLATNEEVLACSRKIEPKEVIIEEAEAIAVALNLPVFVSERGKYHVELRSIPKRSWIAKVVDAIL